MNRLRSVKHSMSESMKSEYPWNPDRYGTRKRVRLNSVDSIAVRCRRYIGRLWSTSGVIDTGRDDRRKIECARTWYAMGSFES
jgi:hypothetical protein